MKNENERQMTQTTQNNEIISNKTNDEKSDKASGNKTEKSNKKKTFRWIMAALIIMSLIFGVLYYVHSLSFESTDDAFIDGNITPISPRISGHISGIYVSDNQWVKKGDLLVEIDPRNFEAELDAAKAGLEAKKAADRAKNVEVELTKVIAFSELNEAADGVEASKAAVLEARARLDLSRAALEQAKVEAEAQNARHQLDVTDLTRYRELIKSRTVSQKDLDHAAAAELISSAELESAKKKIVTQEAIVKESEASLKASEAKLRQANARLSSAESAPQKLKQSQSQADVSHADIDKAAAEVAQAKLTLSYTKIYAPADGYVTKKGVKPGQFVQTGQSLMAIVEKMVWVTANFKETQLTRIRSGQPVEIGIDAYPDITFHGHVDSIQYGTGARFSLLPPENATGNYVKVVQRVPVKIVFDRMEDYENVLLPPGMSVVPEVNIKEVQFYSKQNNETAVKP